MNATAESWMSVDEEAFMYISSYLYDPIPLIFGLRQRCILIISFGARCTY